MSFRFPGNSTNYEFVRCFPFRFSRVTLCTGETEEVNRQTYEGEVVRRSRRPTNLSTRLGEGGAGGGVTCRTLPLVPCEGKVVQTLTKKHH